MDAGSSQYRVLVTGARSWTNYDIVCNAIMNMAFDMAAADRDQLVIVHGACPDGADKLAHDAIAWMQSMGGKIQEESHPANWKLYGRAAGPIRNQAMVNLGADICLAFLQPCSSARCNRDEPHWSHGTLHCLNAAAEAGIQVKFFYGDEEVPEPIVVSKEMFDAIANEVQDSASDDHPA